MQKKNSESSNGEYRSLLDEFFFRLYFYSFISLFHFCLSVRFICDLFVCVFVHCFVWLASYLQFQSNGEINEGRITKFFVVCIDMAPEKLFVVVLVMPFFTIFPAKNRVSNMNCMNTYKIQILLDRIIALESRLH